MLDFASSNIIIRDDFYSNYCNLGGITLYVAAVVALGYICWNFRSWI